MAGPAADGRPRTGRQLEEVRHARIPALRPCSTDPQDVVLRLGVPRVAVPWVHKRYHVRVIANRYSGVIAL